MEICVRNIAGIREGSAEITSGINVVQASNWQGKSSFIRSIETAFGTATPLTEGETEGRVSVSIDDETHEVRLERQGQTVTQHGSPVLHHEYEQLLVDLFAFLGETNEVRQAVRNGDDLKEVLVRPLELEDIDARIRELNAERDAVETELRRAQEQADRLVSLEQRKAELESTLVDLREREAEFEEATESGQRDDLSDLRAERERVTDLIERLENTLERSRNQLEDTYDEHETIDVADASEIEQEIAEIRDEYQQAKEDRELLQAIYSANKRVVEEDRLDLLSSVERGLLEDTHACWLCGSDTTKEEMEEYLEQIGEKVLDLREEVETYDDRIEELEAERDEIKRQQVRKQDLEEKIAELESTIAERSESLSSAEERLETLNEQIDQLEAEVEEVDAEISDIRSEIKYKEAELEDVEAEIDEATKAAERVDTLEVERDDLSEEIAELRNRKNEMQRRIRAEFDEAIQEIVPLFQTSFESARFTSEFELIVARDGREVDLTALSEGEVELLGIITALAGFEAYDVAEVTPVILLDQLGGLADENLTTLTEYLEGRTQSLVLTAYPENSAFGDHSIDPTEWDVVPPAQTPKP